MNRAEAINQLNLKRKRDENDVWEKWFLTESKGQVTSGRLLDRTNALNKIRDEYDKALQQINAQPYEEEGRQRTGREVNRPTNNTPRVRPSTQNTQQDEPVIAGQEVRPKSKITQIQNQQEPNIVRQARKENNQEETEQEDLSLSEESEMNQKNQVKKAPTKKYILSTAQCIVLIILGLIVDLLNSIPFVNILVTALFGPALAWYLRFRGVAIGTTVITTIVDLIPAISIFPTMTLGIIITIIIDRSGVNIFRNIPFLSKLVQK